MKFNEVLIDCCERVHEVVTHVIDGLSPDELTFQPSSSANTIAWLVWHLTRIQDDHIAQAASLEQVWTSAGWWGRFGLPFDESATGYGHGPDDVAAVRVDDGSLLVDYHEAVLAQTRRYLASLQTGDLDRIVDDSFDPPVSLGTRLVSVISDDLQHAGQAAYIRGLLSPPRR